jgi:hypothetical protein
MTNPPGEGPQPEGPSNQPPPEQPGWWQQQAQGQGGYPAQPYPQQGYPQAYIPEHPRATTSLVLGILGIVMCQVVAPFALVIGRRTVSEIDASGGRLGGRGSAQVGYVLGIVGTVMLGLSVLFLLVLGVLFFASAVVSSTR